VALSAAGSSDPAGGRLRYEWNLGDGATAEGQDVVHVFTRPGTHTVTLVVTNDAGATATATADLVVLGNAPVAVIAAPSSDVVVARGQPVVFSSKGSHDDADAEWGGRITGYEWDFGDGTRSTEPNPTKTYPTLSPGQGFVVTLTVVDDDGLRASATRRVVVGNRTPTVRIEASPASGPSPLTVTFRAVVEDEPGLDPPPPLRYSWNFGGGATSNAAAPPPVTFTGDGARTVTLTVVDDAGATASATTVVTVAPTAATSRATGSSSSPGTGSRAPTATRCCCAASPATSGRAAPRPAPR
jgi:PKD repeat protein